MLVDITGTITKVTPKPVSYKAGELKPTMDIRRCTRSQCRYFVLQTFRGSGFPRLSAVSWAMDPNVVLFWAMCWNSIKVLGYFYWSWQFSIETNYGFWLRKSTDLYILLIFIEYIVSSKLSDEIQIKVHDVKQILISEQSWHRVIKTSLVSMSNRVEIFRPRNETSNH